MEASVEPETEEPEITITTKEYDEFDFIRDNLKQMLYLPQFCGICLKVRDDLCSIEAEFEVMTCRTADAKALKDLLGYVFNNQGQDVLASAYVCNMCIDKVLEAYIFIYNTRESSKIINNIINELNYKAVKAIDQLTETENYETSEVVIILENNDNYYTQDVQKEVKTTKKYIENSVTVKKKKTCSKKSTKHAGYRCVECNIIVQTFKEWKNHERDFHEKPQIQCQICNKVLSSEQSLKVHYKTHAMMKCKICHLLVPDGDLNDHFRINHENDKQTCPICNLAFYTSSEINAHLKISHPDEDADHDKSQCLMCLKHFDGDELNEHKCKFRCSECSDLRCIHYKYLISYRDQIRARAPKIKCIDCDYYCHKKDFLVGHANREHLDHIPFACDICGQRFYSKIGLRGHIYQFHTESHICEYCDQEFKGVTSFENHRSSCATAKREFQCNKCPASFESSKHLHNHNKRRHIQETYPCNLCTKIFLTDGKLKEHNVKVHSGLQNRNRRSFTDCVICEQKFDTRGDLKRHIKTHGPNVKFPCRTCNIEFDSLKQLHVHRRKHVKSYFERVQCPVCNMELQSVCLSQHMLRHAVEAGEAPAFRCDICGRACSSEVYLRYHKQSHMEPIPCPKCKKLIKPAGLQKHIKYHEYKDDPVMREKLKRKYKCNLCEYVASDPSILEAHANRHHFKVKPYVCPVCDKDFCGKLQLSRHLETHDATKSFHCEICQKKFSNKICLRMHLRLHTGERPYYCEVCAESFISASALKTHKIKRHSEKSIACPFCNRMFYIAVEMRQHFKKYHWPHKDRKFDHREVEGLSKDYYYLFEDGRRPRMDDDDIASNIIIEEIVE